MLTIAIGENRRDDLYGHHVVPRETLDVEDVKPFEDSIRGQYFRRRIHAALGDANGN